MLSEDISPAQLSHMEHALGLSTVKRRKRDWNKCKSVDLCYRNYFSSGEECDGFGDLMQLAEAGLMSHRRVDLGNGVASDMFHVTPEGFAELQRAGLAPSRQPSRNSRRPTMGEHDACPICGEVEL